jgi:putative sigma-54 modulation protein
MTLTIPSTTGEFMNLKISGHHIEVTPSLHAYVTSKLQRVKRHFDKVIDISVVLGVDRTKDKQVAQHASASIHLKGADIVAQTVHEHLYAAVDELVDILDRQVCRHKERNQSHHVGVKRVAT